MNNSTSSEPDQGGGFDAGGFTYVITFVIGLVFLTLAIAVACVRLRMSRTPIVLNILGGVQPPPRHHAGDQDHSVDELMEQGRLRHHFDTSFESYPKLLYSQVIDQNKGDSSPSSSSCSICLGDYKESDTLRLLPDCGHLYHVACVDPWLRLHSTCPICRKSSVQSPHVHSLAT